MARVCFLLLLMGTALVASAQAPAPPAAPLPAPLATEASATARTILERVGPGLIQIKGFFGAHTAEAFHGSGFAVAPNGLYVTNWHVVSEAVVFPEKYRLEYRTPAGATGRLTVRAIDVRHDLALVQAEGAAPDPLPLRRAPAARGERLYSVGFPLDVGLTITEGVSNGRVADSFQPRIHYAGALNAGMSGGPGLDGGGRVIGVNVAAYRFSQLVSFFVPVEHVVALLATADGAPLDVRRAHDEIGRQLRAHSNALLDAIGPRLPTQSHQGYALPARPAAFIDCRAQGDPAPGQTAQVEHVQCDAKASLYVTSRLSAGGLSFQHSVLTSETLDAWRFAHRLNALATRLVEPGSARDLAPFACRQDNVDLHGLRANALVCLQAYRKLEGLYNVVVQVTSKNEPRRGFVSRLRLTGVTAERGLAFVRAYLEAIRWTP